MKTKQIRDALKDISDDTEVYLRHPEDAEWERRPIVSITVITEEKRAAIARGGKHSKLGKPIRVVVIE